MKNLFSIVAFFVSLFVVSCNTCTTCTYETKDGEELTEEVCGNADESEDFRKEIEDSAYVNRSKFDCTESN